MGYFNALASGIIKKDGQNRSVYYPWGVLGKGYVLPTEAHETQIKTLVIRFYQIMFALIFIMLLFRAFWLTLPLCLGLAGWFLYSSYRFTQALEISQEKLTLKEAYTNSGKQHNLIVLWILLGVSVIFTCFGLLLLLVGKLGAGLFFTTLFGLCTAAIGYMVKVKQSQPK
jgi:hypothetical protein